MTSPSDPFSESFNSIEIDPARKPSIEAISDALAACVQAPDALSSAGFYLLDDAGGRFVVDRDWGVISLKDEMLLETERNSLHEVRLKVIEPSGETYELDLKLQITGLVPQLVVEDELEDQYDLHDAEASQPPLIHWTRYVAVAGLYKPASLPDNDAPFGTMLSTHIPHVAAGFAGLTLVDDLPAPSSRTSAWTL